MAIITPLTLAHAMQKKFTDIGMLNINASADNLHAVTPKDVGLAIQKAAQQLGIDGISPNAGALVTVAIDHTTLDVLLDAAWKILDENNGIDMWLAINTYNSGTICTSSDGITWKKNSTSAGFSIMLSVIYANSLFVTCGSGGKIFTSPDTNIWTSRVSGTNGTFNSIAYGNGIFVACGGDTNRLVTSPDGITWTFRSDTVNVTKKSVVYANGLFFIVGDDGYSDRGFIETSPDGITWTNRLQNASFTLRDIAYGNGIFVAAGNNLSGVQGYVLTSTDMITWIPRSVGNNLGFYKIIYANSLFVTCGSGGNIYTSPDGITWTLRSSGTSSIIYDIYYGNELFVAVGEKGLLITSPDGITWTKINLALNNNDFRCVTYAKVPPPPLVATNISITATQGQTISHDLSQYVSGGVPPYTFTVS